MEILKELDEIDRSIIQHLQDDPNVTHSRIAELLDRSQPAIGARIKKLESKGLIATQIGVDFHEMDEFNLVILNIKTSRTVDIMDLSAYCPFIINALKTSGDYNMTLFLASTNLKQLDNVIDRHFREKEWTNALDMKLVTGIAKKFVLPIDFDIEKMSKNNDPCANSPFCAHARSIAGVRSKEELNLT